jgi:hypothetical protein
LRMAWLMKNCFFLVGDTRLAGELGREVHLRASIRLREIESNNYEDSTIVLTYVFGR